jgi:flagellar protein FliO/FliZ
MTEVVLRITFSLLVVLAILWGLARVVRRSPGRANGTVAVLNRQHLTRNTSVVVVRVGERALVLGVTEAHVTLLTETDPEPFLPDGAPPVRRHEVAVPGGSDGQPPRPPSQPVPAEGGRLQGSLLSPRTWAQTIEFLRERTARQR